MRMNQRTDTNRFKLPYGLVWFTVGSKGVESTEGDIHGARPKKDFRLALVNQATVFQAEVYAILR